MNRYVAAGILADLAAGKNILALFPDDNAARAAYRELIKYAMEQGFSLSPFVSGRALEVRLADPDGTGRATFVGESGRHFRGYSPSVLYLDPGVDYDPARMGPMLFGGGEMIRG